MKTLRERLLAQRDEKYRLLSEIDRLKLPKYEKEDAVRQEMHALFEESSIKRLEQAEHLYAAEVDSIKLTLETKIDSLQRQVNDAKAELDVERKHSSDKERHLTASFQGHIDTLEAENKALLEMKARLYKVEADPKAQEAMRLRIEHEILIEELKEKLVRMQQAAYSMERLYVSALETSGLVVSGDGGRFYHAAGFAVGEEEAVRAYEQAGTSTKQEVIFERNVNAAAERLAAEEEVEGQVLGVEKPSGALLGGEEGRAGIADRAMDGGFHCPSCARTKAQWQLDKIGLLRKFQMEMDQLQRVFGERRGAVTKE